MNIKDNNISENSTNFLLAYDEIDQGNARLYYDLKEALACTSNTQIKKAFFKFMTAFEDQITLEAKTLKKLGYDLGPFGNQTLEKIKELANDECEQIIIECLTLLANHIINMDFYFKRQLTKTT